MNSSIQKIDKPIVFKNYFYILSYMFFLTERHVI